MAKKRPNIVPIIEDARHPQKYRMLVPMVDVIFADVAQPDQVRHKSRFRRLPYCFATAYVSATSNVSRAESAGLLR